MAALARETHDRLIDPPTPLIESTDPQSYAALETLARLHAEAEETARLASLLSGSLPAAAALAVAAATAFAFGGGTAWEAALWLGFIGSAVLAMLYFYLGTIRRPFAPLRLRLFAARLSSTLLYAGFAWGAGAYLALPSGVELSVLTAFVAAPTLAVILALREREAAFLFLAPLGMLASFAAVLRPAADGVLAAAAVVATCAALCAVAVLRDRRRLGDFLRPAMLHLR